ncbi:MAG: hypothetical protein IIA10_04340 [Proteobacteria bacterium]|nr:hypothetical protein [Pseudomonadota bacterium]
MALPADTAVETAIATIEQALVEDFKVRGARQAISQWRGVLDFIEGLGGTGYDALTQRDWSTDKLGGA